MRRAAALLLLVAIAAGCGGSDSSSGPQATSCDVEIQDPTHPPDLQPLARDARPQITFVTSHGTFTVEIDGSRAPCNGDSMVDLAKRGFFDNTRFHRIVPGFIIQGGDPTATGQGGPGYTTHDPPPASTRYTHGVVATAKTQLEPAGTSGSQFFVVTAPNAGLPPDYAVLGKVVSGLPVVDRIGRLGDQSTEQPTQVVEIERATVSPQ